MRWKPGDKCILDTAVFSRIVKTFGPETHREPEVYVVVDSDPTQAVVIIAGKDGKASLVLDSWIVPLNETDWKACKQILEKSYSPTDLIKRLNDTKPMEQPKVASPQKSDPLPDTKKTLMKMLDQLEIALSGSLTIIMAVVRVYLQRHW